MSASLMNAEQAAKAVCEELRAALAQAKPVESLVLMPMLSTACALRSEITALLCAKGPQG